MVKLPFKFVNVIPNIFYNKSSRTAGPSLPAVTYNVRLRNFEKDTWTHQRPPPFGCGKILGELSTRIPLHQSSL